MRLIATFYSSQSNCGIALGVETCYRKITTMNLFEWRDLDVHFTLKLVNCFSFERPLFGSVL